MGGDGRRENLATGETDKARVEIDRLLAANASGGQRVFARFMSALLTSGSLRLVGGGRARQAFLHVQDANLAFQTLLEAPDVPLPAVAN